MSKYYCLIAGLPDLSLEDGKLSYTVATFKTEIYPTLSAADRRLVDLFYLRYDNANLLTLLADREASIRPLGSYSAEQLLDLIATVKEGERRPKGFPSYMIDFTAAYLSGSAEMRFPADVLASGYYAHAMDCGNRFVRDWFEFNLNLNNVLAALTARKYKWEVAPYVVGEGEVADAIRTSAARDFGLADRLDCFDQLLRISETDELVEREKRTDLLKWVWMEDATVYDYFTIERLFVFLLRLDLIERWISLDKEKGSILFRSLIGTLKNEVQIPSEFRK